MSERWPWQSWNPITHPGYCPTCWGPGLQVELLWPPGTPPPANPQAGYVCELNHHWTARVLYGPAA